MKPINDMNVKRTKAELRQEKLLELLKQHQQLSVHQMVDRLMCSEATVRRDLDALAQTGQIIRTVGGARYHDPMPGISFHAKEQYKWEEKEWVAEKASSLVHPGDVIGLTGGTTTFLIARAVKSLNDVTIVTNAVNIAMEVADNSSIQVVLTGGVMNNETFELSGPLAEEKLDQLYINKMFLGIDGIHADLGLTTHSELEARMAKIMMKRSEQTIAVFDDSKLDKTSLFPITSLSEINGVVCNKPLSEPLTRACEQLKIAIY